MKSLQSNKVYKNNRNMTTIYLAVEYMQLTISVLETGQPFHTEDLGVTELHERHCLG